MELFKSIFFLNTLHFNFQFSSCLICGSLQVFDCSVSYSVSCAVSHSVIQSFSQSVSQPEILLDDLYSSNIKAGNYSL